MARIPDKNVIRPDEKTRLVRVSSPDPGPDSEPNRGSAPTGLAGAAGDRAERTMLVGAQGSNPNVIGQPQSSDDPVVGWVAVIEGPGKGRSLPLGYGMNEISRSPRARVPLDFGDHGISRERHAVITFDPRGLKFYIQQGDGKNLTYLGDQPVLTPRELESGQEITLGETRLRFVALCGPDFDWQKR